MNHLTTSPFTAVEIEERSSESISWVLVRLWYRNEDEDEDEDAAAHIFAAGREYKIGEREKLHPPLVVLTRGLDDSYTGQGMPIPFL